MPKKLLRRILPDRETIERFPISRRFTRHLDLPGLWKVEREPIAMGLAIGVFCGMIPGPLQMIAAVALACLLRINLPMAIIGTFFSNPITIVPLYMLAYAIGQGLTGNPQWTQLPPIPESDWTQIITSIQAWTDWMASLGAPWLLGMLVLSFGLLVTTYCVVQLLWRVCRSWSWRCVRAHRKNRSMPMHRHGEVN
jgi:uncharacterized protein (DUF2062 family)